MREVLQQRSFTRIGRALRGDGRIAPEKVAEVAGVVATGVRVARELGVRDLRAVATAAIRQAHNRDELCAAVRETAGVAVEILPEVEEARLAFLGATRTLAHPAEGELAMVDVGGGSTELAVGSVASGMRWSASLRVGSGGLADSYLRSDPPAAHELEAVRAHVAGAFEGIAVPAAREAIAVGGSATSLRRLVGAVLEPETLERGMRVLARTPADEVVRSFAIDAERVRLLPAGILILEAASSALGLPLQIGRGGLREGVILEMGNTNG